jgi:hypothetical protein
MTNKRRNKGPEHIRDIIKDAKKEWEQAHTDKVKSTERFRELEEQCPAFLQIVFMYIEGDPQYIRILYLN